MTTTDTDTCTCRITHGYDFAADLATATRFREVVCVGRFPVCDHCGGELTLEYRPPNKVRWTHATGPVGRWSCPTGHGMASVNGTEWFAGEAS